MKNSATQGTPQPGVVAATAALAPGGRVMATIMNCPEPQVKHRGPENRRLSLRRAP
jgi:hypothetical protein